MRGIQSFGQNLAMDGHKYYSPRTTPPVVSTNVQVTFPDAADVAKNLADNLANVQRHTQELQRIANSMGRKLRFNVNEELGQVVVKIVDPSTDKVLREIPSVDMQELRIMMRQTIGVLVDETV